MKKLLLSVAIFLTSCTYYTEKQSEAVSQNVYATNQALNKARVDLAWFYSNETTKFIVPPKHPIAIESVYEMGDVIKNPKNTEKTRVVIIPDQYKNDKVVVVGSNDYNELLKDREIKKQLELDNKNKENQIIANNKELTKQKEMKDKMVSDLQHLQAEIYKKDRGIWVRNFIILGLLTIVGGYIYLRASKFLLF
jgi:hypothetical protein